MAVGRISGPLLKDNLLRNGVNLAFETNLLYLDVNNRRVGINTAAPTNDLQVSGTTRSTNLIVDNTSTLATFTISSNTISSTSSTINLTPSGVNPVVYQGLLSVGNFNVTGNTISTTGTNTNINISPNGTGQTVFNSNVLVNGNLHATGTITADGNLTLGSSSSDTIAFTGEVDSNILPSATNTYNLGSSALQWNNVYTNNLIAGTITVSSITTTDVKTANLDISGNTISTFTANTDIQFTTSGTGGIDFGNFRFYGNSITNTVANAVSTFAESGTGYTQFTGTYGVVIPSGNSTTQRPVSPMLGMIRFNTDSSYVEVYTGSVWVSVSGGGGVSFSTAQDQAIEAALFLG
jgi:hypothetical protein